MDNLFNFPNTLTTPQPLLPAPPAPPPAPCSSTKEWLTNLKEVETYIDKNKKRPLNNDKDKNVRKYANWINRQQRRYQNKDKSILPSNIKKLWEDFINDDKYKEYFICRKE
jgi:hypothetical protein